MSLMLGSRDFGDDSCVVMAIVNRTPDSFYDRGATYGDAAALDRVAEVSRKAPRSWTSAVSRPGTATMSTSRRRSAHRHAGRAGAGALSRDW